MAAGELHPDFTGGIFQLSYREEADGQTDAYRDRIRAVSCTGRDISLENSALYGYLRNGFPHNGYLFLCVL